MVRVLIGKFIVDGTDTQLRTPLFYATEAGSSALEIVELLLSHGAVANRKDRAGLTPAIIAAEHKKPKLDVIKTLLKTDRVSLLDAVARCKSKDTSRDQRVMVVNVLLECGADLTACRSKEKETVMHIAAGRGCLAVLEALAIHKRDEVEEAETTEGERPIHISVSHEWPELVQYFLDQNPSNTEARTIRGWTPLHIAAAVGNATIVSILVNSMHARSSLVHRTYSSMYAPIEVACSRGHDDAAISLLEAMTKSQIFSKSNRLEEPLLSIAAGSGCIRVVQRLVEIAKRNEQLPSLLAEISPADGMTAAYFAVANNESKTAKFLMDCGAPMTGMSSNGNTALHWAATHGMEEVAISLLDMQSEADGIRNKAGETALDCAAKNLHTNVVAHFLKRQDPGRNVATCVSGWTSLHWATWYQRLDLVRSMVIAGADIKAKDAIGLTAAELVKDISSGLITIELAEWLTPATVYDAGTPDHPPPRPKPAANAEGVCKDLPTCLVGVYTGESHRSIEKTGFSVYNTVYEHGPHKIITAVARAQQVQGDLACLWLHMPANNVSTSMALPRNGEPLMVHLLT